MGLHSTVKSAYIGFGNAATNNRLQDWKWFAEQEINTWNHWISMPLQRRLWLWRRGFPSPYEKIYDFETHRPEEYLSELQRYRLYKSINGPHRYLIDDKLSQYWMLADFPENRPNAYGLVDRGRIRGMAGTELNGEQISISEWLPSALRQHSKLVMKQLRGKGGKEVVICEYDKGEFILDFESVTEKVLCEEVSNLSGYLVTDYVEQHSYADDLYPHAANTIRLLTLWDDKAEELYLPTGVHRIGTERSRPIDNWSAGGIAADIDLETGELGRAAQLPFSGDVRWFETHPDTGSQITGVTIPHWDTVCETVKEIARDNTNIPALGWDIILDKSGTPIVIEANTGTATRTFQVHKPLLTDPRVASIASRHLDDVDEKVPNSRKQSSIA